MFPSQTSLIPIAVALTRFLETNGLNSFSLNYPYWYLGTTPFKYLAGPIVPLVLATLHQAMPFISLFNLSIYLIFVSFVVSIIGWGLLIKAITHDRRIVLMVIFLTSILPWRYFSAITFEETTVVIAKNFLPFVLLGLWNLLEKKSLKNWLIAVCLISFLLFINTTIIPVLLVGIVVISLAKSFENGKFKKFSRYLIINCKLLIISLGLVTLWYSPHYWLTILFNPSIGGVNTLEAIKRLIDFLKASLPLVLAVLAVYFSGKIKSRLSVLALTWMGTFFFLTIFRFMGDPDFWMDWKSWFGELEIGAALLIAKNLPFTIYHLPFEKTYKSYIVNFALLIFPFLAVFLVYRLIGRPSLLTKTPPGALQSLAALNTAVKKDNGRVFLSGATVFWLNAFYDIPQVRGGADQAAVNPFWNKAAYEIREGNKPELSLDWAEKLKIKYVLVHTSASLEYFQDFRNIGKWKEIGQIVWQGGGDIVYKIFSK